MIVCELKPCPFCGARAHLDVFATDECDISVFHEDGCWLLGWEGAFDVPPCDREEYVEAWNRRANG